MPTYFLALSDDLDKALDESLEEASASDLRRIQLMTIRMLSRIAFSER